MTKDIVFITQALCSDELYCEGPTTAVITITEDDVKRIAQLRKAVEDLDVHKIEDFDYSPTWYESYLGEEKNAEELECENFMQLKEEQGLENEEISRMDCCTLDVTAKGFKWSAYVKHTDVLKGTPTIPFTAIGLPKELK